MYKSIILLYLLLLNCHGYDLNRNDVIETIKFLKLNSFPSIVQDDKYIETEKNKPKLSFSLTQNQRIQGLYLGNENKIYLYNIIDLDKRKKECEEIEKFLKKGYLVHELTHYKQKKGNAFYKEITYKDSDKEAEAIKNQLTFWKENKNKIEKEFILCKNQSSQEWFLNYLKEAKEINKAFEYAYLEELKNQN